ncbi:MAG: biliverdin-producing heme oxygenase [Phycisphaerales bacterium JB047]
MLTNRLKDDNWALHQIAERQETPGSLIKGTMPKAGYIGMLEQQLLINTTLDAALRDAVKADPRVSELVLEEQMLSPYIAEDLAYFGVDIDSIEPTSGTARYIEHINSNRENPLHLLGLHYVRLGACNGNRFVARVVRKVYALGESEGTRYLDPFGEKQRVGWVEFKAALDAMPFNDDEQDTVFEGTRAAYLYAINMDHPTHLTAEQLLDMHGKTLDKKAFEEGHSVHVPSNQH